MALYLGVDGGGIGLPRGGGRRLRAGARAGRGGLGQHLDRSRRRAREHPRRGAGGARCRGGGARARRPAWRCSGSPGANVAGRGGAAGAGGCRSRASRSRSDAVVALKGALGDDDGITAAIGTGSVFGVQRGGGGADDRRLGVPARRPGQRRGDGAGALRARRCSRTTARSSATPLLGGAPRRARRAGGDRRLRPGRRGRRTSRGWCRASSRRRRRATRRRRRSSTRPRPRSRGRSTG